MRQQKSKLAAYYLQYYPKFVLFADRSGIYWAFTCSMLILLTRLSGPCHPTTMTNNCMTPQGSVQDHCAMRAGDRGLIVINIIELGNETPVIQDQLLLCPQAAEEKGVGRSHKSKSQLIRCCSDQLYLQEACTS